MARDAYSEYWIDAVSESCCENGVSLNSDVMNAIAKDMQNAHEMYSEAFGHHNIPNPLVSENKSLQSKLIQQSDKADEKLSKRENELIETIKHWRRKYENATEANQ